VEKEQQEEKQESLWQEKKVYWELYRKNRMEEE